MRARNSILTAAMALALTAGWPAMSARAESIVRYGISMADIPLTTGQPDRGAGAYQFTAYTIYDPLVAWEMDVADRPGKLVPGLATEWKVDDTDKTKWVFKLRPGVSFHDGSPFNADAVVWNVDKVLKQDAPQYDASQVGVTASRMPTLVSARKIDDMTVELTTKEPDSFLPINLTNLFMASPAKWRQFYDKAEGADAKAKSQAAWAAFAKDASGNGPWKMSSFTPRERLELVKNENYWDKARVPKTDKMVLLPMPEANARTAALLSGQVDWIEQPSPDAVPQLKSAGMTLTSNCYPHIWPYHPSLLETSPFKDVRVRKALNLAIDRDGIVQLMGGLALPAKGHVLPDSPWFGKPSFEPKYDPAAAKKLLAEAGFSGASALRLKFAISASGSGQMLPLPMNEYVQQNLAAIGVKLDFDVSEWQALLDRWRAGAKGDVNKGIDAVNISYTTQDPYSTFTRFLRSSFHAPAGVNFGFYSDPEMEKLLDAAQLAFEPEARNAALARVH